MIPQLKKLAMALPVGLLLLSASVAQAGDISSIIFRIDATNTVGSGYLEFSSADLTYNPATNQWVWAAGHHELLDGGGDVVAILDSATLKLVKDPAPNKPYCIELDFAVHAGISDTDFSVKSAMLSFPTLLPSRLQPPTGGGRAVVSFRATDTNANGVTFMATGPSGVGAYTAQYNGWAPGGTTFATLVNEISVGPGGSAAGGQTFPTGSGYAAINDSVSDMSAIMAFGLTFGDSASGTSTYGILPEPTAGLGVMLLGAVALGWRRR